MHALRDPGTCAGNPNNTRDLDKLVRTCDYELELVSSRARVCVLTYVRVSLVQSPSVLCGP